MAHLQTSSVPARISSYAKIAAMPAPPMIPVNSNARKEVKPSPQTAAERLSNPSTDPQPVQPVEAVPVLERGLQAAITSLQIPTSKLSLEESPMDSTQSEPNADSGDSYEEDQSQLSSSSLNKPQSFDTKSLTSVTTFAMDDKESIRPDDSASVRADDEILPAALSRNSSFQHDTDPASHRFSRTFPSNVTIPGRRFGTLVNPPRFGNLPISPVLECQDVQLPKSDVQIISPDDPRQTTTIAILPPDEKLMDALASAKDRLPLLQLEEKVLLFLASTTNEVLDLPPQNSFTRLLTHKLADYYSLPHAVTGDNSSVRIFRAGIRAAPTSLAQIAKSVPIGSSAAPNTTAVKIMRREKLGRRQFSAGHSNAPSSSAASKTTSENGVEGRSEDDLMSPIEGTPGRDKSKLTLAEREIQYKAARDRIFADFQEPIANEMISTGDNSASMSRSSSSSGKKKNKRHKQPKDDSFEARSAYIASYTPVQGQYSSQYPDGSMINGYPVSPVSYDPSMYGATPTQAYPGFDASMQYPTMHNYNHPMQQQQFGLDDWQTMQAMQMQSAYFMYPHAMQYPQAPNVMMPGTQPMQSQVPDWCAAQAQNFTSSTYSGPGSLFFPTSSEQPTPIQSPQYGQQFARGHPTASAHGQQVSKGNKSLFNPQTRSFVPTNDESRAVNRNARYKSQPRHNSNSNVLSPPFTTGGTSTSAAKEDSLKLRYGTPSSLPKKPPPSDPRYYGDGSNSSNSVQPEIGSSTPIPTLGQ